MNLYKQEEIQQERLKIKKNLLWAGFFFVLSLVYTYLGWQFMMGFYGSFLTVLVLSWLFLPIIPFAIYFVIGFALWIATWQFIEAAANAKKEVNFLLWISRL